mgnify:CR=1 FL=1
MLFLRRWQGDVCLSSVIRHRGQKRRWRAVGTVPVICFISSGFRGRSSARWHTASFPASRRISSASSSLVADHSNETAFNRRNAIRVKKVLIIMGRYLPGYKDGGPVRSIKNLVDRLGDILYFFTQHNTCMKNIDACT